MLPAMAHAPAPVQVVDRVAHGEGLGPLVTVVHGTLPLGLGLPPGSQAAILCAEVLQFLLPHQVPPALRSGAAPSAAKGCGRMWGGGGDSQCCAVGWHF